MYSPSFIPINKESEQLSLFILLIVTLDPNYYPISYIFYCKVTIFKSIEVKDNNQIQLNQSKVKEQAYIPQSKQTDQNIHILALH